MEEKMTCSTKPIPLNNVSPAHDYNDSSRSPFNPASYARHFLGSPISWRPASFGADFPARFPAGSPSAHLFNSLDFSKQPSSVESDRGSILNALNVFDREGELCRNYTCCGLHLNDLHALLEHFEDVHIVVLDSNTSNPQAHIQVPFNPVVNLPYSSPFDTDDMELDLDLDPPPHHRSSPSSGAPSPPDTPISTPLSAYPSPRAFSSHLPLNNPPSPRLTLPAFPRQPPAVLTNPEEAFNAYARFSADYSSCLPGAQFNGASVDEANRANTQWHNNPHHNHLQQHQQQRQGHLTHNSACVPPALLFSSSTGVTPVSTPGGSRVPSPSAHPLSHTQSMPTTPISGPSHSLVSRAIPTSANSPVGSSSGSTLSRPGASLLLSKPFRCPKPNCNKSYKQANGLKYHMTHGSCNFAPPKDLEHVKDLLERKRRERERERGLGEGLTRSASLGALSSSGGQQQHHDQLGSSSGQNAAGGAGSSVGNEVDAYADLTETELRDIEREAEKRLRPFACGVGDCQRRYKNMNGLRYHYQHSGDHGALGLGLLASGQHECLQGGHGRRGGSASNMGSVPVSRSGSTSASASVSVSRSGSTAVSRTGTPQPVSSLHYPSNSTSSSSSTSSNTPSIPSTLSNNGNGAYAQQQLAYQYAQMQRQAHAQQQAAAVAAAQQQQYQADHTPFLESVQNQQSVFAGDIEFSQVQGQFGNENGNNAAQYNGAVGVEDAQFEALGYAEYLPHQQQMNQASPHLQQHQQVMHAQAQAYAAMYARHQQVQEGYAAMDATA